MKYKDKNISIESDVITLYDPDRPTQALIDIFNPVHNTLKGQGQSIVIRVNGILHEYTEPIQFGIADTTLHCLMPILIYSRKSTKDQYFSLSNNLVIQDTPLAKDLLLSVDVKFYQDSKKLIYDVFKNRSFVYLVIGIDDEETIFTAVDKLSEQKGAITIHNPMYKPTTPIMKYCLDRNIHLIENIDGSAEIVKA